MQIKHIPVASPAAVPKGLLQYVDRGTLELCLHLIVLSLSLVRIIRILCPHILILLSLSLELCLHLEVRDLPSVVPVDFHRLFCLHKHILFRLHKSFLSV